MIFWEVFKMSAMALNANRLRGFLTLLGVIIGVTSVITIISALEGLSQSIRSELEALGPSTFIVTKFGIIRSEEEFLKAIKRRPLKYEHMEAIEEGCDLCQKVAVASHYRVETKHGTEKLRRVLVEGASAGIIDIVDTEVDQGRYFAAEEEHSRSRVAFIGYNIREELYPGVDPIGKWIKLNNIKYRIIGVAKEKGSTFDDNSDRFVSIPYTTFVKDFAYRNMGLSIYVKAASVEVLPEAMDQARAILRAYRHVPYDKDDDFGIVTADAIMAVINDITKVIRFGLIGISSIALVVGGIIIMNIMMVSVTERTREIGIRKSVGARQRDILLQFLYESLMLSLGGGIIGIAIGVFLGDILIGLIEMDMSPSAFAITIGLIISTGTGLFFGIYPAMKAARLQPVKALGYE